MERFITVVAMVGTALLLVIVAFTVFLSQNDLGESGQMAGIVSATKIATVEPTFTPTATVAVEQPTQTPTDTPTATATEAATETPVVLEATDTPTATVTAAPTQTPTPEMALTGGWVLENGDNGHRLTADQAVLILAFNGTDRVYLYPDQDGKVNYSQVGQPNIDGFGLIGVVPLNQAPFKITIVPFRQDGHKLVLLDPTASKLVVKDQDTLMVSNNADDHTNKSEVLRFGCKTEACARMVLIAMGQAGPNDTIDCQSSTKTLVTQSGGWLQTYRGANSWSIGETGLGPNINLGSVRKCTVGQTTWYVDRYGSIIYGSGKIGPVPTSTPKPAAPPQPTEVIIVSDGDNAGGGNVESSGSSGDNGGYNQPDQGGTQIESGGGGVNNASSGQSSGDCPDCNPVEVPPTPTAESQVGVKPTPTQIH